MSFDKYKYSNLPVEATAFLGAVAGFGVLLFVLFLYLSRKWCFTPVNSSIFFGKICVPFCESNKSSVSHLLKNSGKTCSYSDPETTSDSEEDALQKLNSCSQSPSETFIIKAKVGSTTLTDAGITLSSCTKEQFSQQCIVEVGVPNILLENKETKREIEQHNTLINYSSPSVCIVANEISDLEVAFMYDAPMREMKVHVLQGRNYPSGIGSNQVRMVLLPSKKQKRKTRVRQGTSPQYMESFLLPRVNPEDVNAMGIRLRVYWWGGRIRRERLLGEAKVFFNQINLQLETTLWLPLQLSASSQVQNWRSSSLIRSDSTDSQHSIQSYILPSIPAYGSSMKGGNTAEILIGLAYNGITGRLSAEIIKGSHFRGEGGSDIRPPDTYVKLTLINSNGQEMGRSKTGLKRAQPNPLYKETFIFQVALFQLGDVTLFLSVYNRRRGGMGRKGRELIGWLCLGLNSSGSEELKHWNEMRTARQPTQVQRWHSLLRP